MTLGLTILSNCQLPPQKWKLRSGLAFKFMFPPSPSSIRQLIYSGRSFISLHSILCKSRMIRYSAHKSHHVSSRLTSFAVNKIIKQAKNLKSLTLDGKCDLSNFKRIRKVKNLQHLSLRTDTNAIGKYPQLFKRLTSLQKVKFFLTWFKKDSKNKILKRFFESVINLPKLQHLTIWLDQGFGPDIWLRGDFLYYQTLLAEINKSKLPSFEVIVCNTSAPPYPSNSTIDWGNFIETLYIGPIMPLQHHNESWSNWPLVKNPERRLRLNGPLFNWKIEKLANESIHIKNLTLFGLFGKEQDYSMKDARSLLKFLSQIKTLENLTMTLEADCEKKGAFLSALNQKLSQVESLESLTTLTLDLRNYFQIIPAIMPPYGRKMKNFKTLSLNISGHHFDLLSWAETLKDLVSLENLNFDYKELENVACDFPFEGLRNLKSIYLNCNVPFSKNSREHLLEGLLEVESLKSLKIEGAILYDLMKKKASGFIENLRGKKNLEVASFRWKGAKSLRWTEVKIVRDVNGEMIVSSEYEKQRY